jgi:hypothetical protein
MRKLIVLVCLGGAVSVSASVYAGPQQDKMKGCSKEAAGLKGDERKAFMKKCLSKDYVLKSGAAAETKAETAAASKQPVASSDQKEKMKACNADAKAKELKGDVRKQFISTCLKS